MLYSNRFHVLQFGIETECDVDVSWLGLFVTGRKTEGAAGPPFDPVIYIYGWTGWLLQPDAPPSIVCNFSGKLPVPLRIL